ncbi:hypothetical protein [Polyangium fumosum]|uniref:Uncharacterized protein n=1 Tax=Polyangium fumosum TaxID=889272 RepID=A0A4U1J0H5_9BACT|nr:hypothetical protein [Polyangium fumosum]TKD00418.1 hypothetical protein E8A74_34555 [Polyangium fumosum]
MNTKQPSTPNVNTDPTAKPRRGRKPKQADAKAPSAPQANGDEVFEPIADVTDETAPRRCVKLTLFVPPEVAARLRVEQFLRPPTELCALTLSSTAFQVLMEGLDHSDAVRVERRQGAAEHRVKRVLLQDAFHQLANVVSAGI